MNKLLINKNKLNCCKMNYKYARNKFKIMLRHLIHNNLFQIYKIKINKKGSNFKNNISMKFHNFNKTSKDLMEN